MLDQDHGLEIKKHSIDRNKDRLTRQVKYCVHTNECKPIMKTCCEKS